MKVLRLCLVLALLVLLVTTAFASRVQIDYTGPDNAQWRWSEEHWDTSGEVCRLDVALEWHVEVGSVNSHTMLGYQPNDPIVDQLITNYSSMTWTDWHVSLVNGRIIQDSAVVRKDGDVYDWEIGYESEGGDIIGFYALGSPPAQWVGNREKLKVYFVFEPINASEEVYIQQFPTDELIPEPASLTALGMGLATVGFALRRRKK